LAGILGVGGIINGLNNSGFNPFANNGLETFGGNPGDIPNGTPPTNLTPVPTTNNTGNTLPPWHPDPLQGYPITDPYHNPLHTGHGQQDNSWLSPQFLQSTSTGATPPALPEIVIDRTKYPETAQHIENAIAAGHPDELIIARPGAKGNRKESLKNYPTVPGKDRDEYPPAVFQEGGTDASVQPINPSDNRGAGSSMGHQLKPYPNGTKVKIVVKGLHEN
jgi:hypothetical protein